MPRYIAALVLPLLIVLVLTRVWLLSRRGTGAMHFGKIDKKDFLLPPFALFYFYCVFAGAFGWPAPGQQVIFTSEAVAWGGVALCTAGLVVFMSSLVAFGSSFRVGIDTTNAGKLITTGIFRFTRNPIYVAFWIILLGEFLVYPSWLLLVYLAAASWLFHRQVLREEAYLKQHYGSEYTEYSGRVRRYI